MVAKQTFGHENQLDTYSRGFDVIVLKKHYLALSLAVCLGVLPVAAMAQSSSDVFNRLTRIENELDTLNRAVYRGERPPPSADSFVQNDAVQANVEVRIQQLETELRNLTGTIEQQSFALQQLQNDFKKLSGDINVRLSDIESGKSALSSGNGFDGVVPTPTRSMDPFPPAGSAAQKTVSASGQSLGTIPDNANGTQPLSNSSNDPASDYENAFSLLKNSNFAAAEKGFASFLSNFPDHQLSSNAQYWLGETFYVRGNYERAARVFAEGYQKFPQSNKAADNLLKLGMSLAGVGNSQDACVALRQLKSDYPDGPAPVLRRADQEMGKLGCS